MIPMSIEPNMVKPSITRLTERDDATQLLEGWRSRDKKAEQLFFAAAYEDIKAIVRRLREKNDPSKTILCDASVTELSHEAILKLNRWRNDETPFTHRKEFIEYVRRSVWHLLFADPGEMAKRQEYKLAYLSQLNDTQDDSITPDMSQSHDLHKALLELRNRYPEQAEVFEYKHFAAVTNKEIATLLKVSERTVNNRLQFATHFLKKSLT